MKNTTEISNGIIDAHDRTEDSAYVRTLDGKHEAHYLRDADSGAWYHDGDVAGNLEQYLRDILGSEEAKDKALDAVLEKTQIYWTENSRESARLAISDGVITHYASEDKLPATIDMRAVAEAYAKDYDRNGNRDGYIVAQIEDLSNRETHSFAFDWLGDFEWDTRRNYIY